MSQGFNHFLRCFASFCIGKISHLQHKGYKSNMPHGQKEYGDKCSPLYGDIWHIISMDLITVGLTLFRNS